MKPRLRYWKFVWSCISWHGRAGSVYYVRGDGYTPLEAYDEWLMNALDRVGR